MVIRALMRQTNEENIMTKHTDSKRTPAAKTRTIAYRNARATKRGATVTRNGRAAR